MTEQLAVLREALIAADPVAAEAATKALIDEGVNPRVILESGLAEAMQELGEKWKCGQAFLPEVVASAEIFKRCSQIVEPVLIAQGGGTTGKPVVMATVKGDLHDLGKNMVGAMMRTAGFDVHDLGKDVPAETIVAAVRDKRAAILGLSALLTTTVDQQQVVIELLAAEGLRDGVKVMVGGAPATQEWADKIGADGFAPSAPEAVEVALKLVGEAANA